MTAKILQDRLIAFAEKSIKAEEQARANFTAILANPTAAVLPSDTRSLHTAVAEAKPWRQLLADTHDGNDALEVMNELRAVYTRQLLSPGRSASTCAFTNEVNDLERDALCKFLEATRFFVSAIEDMDREQDQAPIEKAAPTAEPQPAPTAKPAKAPKATPAQKRALAAIRDNGVRRQESSTKRGVQVMVERGEKPRRDMVEWAVEQGWAQIDVDHSLFHGQPVTLTEIGEAILAG